MDNKDIIRLIKRTAQLMELHDENPFKTRSYQNASFALDKVENALSNMNLAELEKIDGLGKSLAAAVHEIAESGNLGLLEKLQEDTPSGVIQMLEIKGLGPKKIRAIWKDLDITSLEDLKTACEKGIIAKAKGFGAKTQEKILASLAYFKKNTGKLRLDQALELAQSLENPLKEAFPDAKIALVGELSRRCESISEITFLALVQNKKVIQNWLAENSEFIEIPQKSGPMTWCGQNDAGLLLCFYFCQEERYISERYLLSASPLHLSALQENGLSLFSLANSEKFSSEEAIFESAGLPYIPLPMREGLVEFKLAKEGNLSSLIQLEDLKGTLHNHSTYSDGKHSLKAMADHARELGYQYLGISDHSKSAGYAGGLQVEKVQKQHKEIEELNKGWKDFCIFKGIESDILMDGSLDYEAEVLASFDFIVASIHSGLDMDIQKATSRLLNAIQNPYTTILGHPTGRLIIQREGYPIDFKKVIEACAEHQVIIEINASPYRLDLDWRWLPYAIECGVMISINPDAHEKDGYQDMLYGVYMAQKAGLGKEQIFNCLSQQEVADYFKMRKEKILKMA